MKLIETILVDDDQLALEYIEELIDWQAAGFHIAGRALDGEQGYRLYQRVRQAGDRRCAYAGHGWNRPR